MPIIKGRRRRGTSLPSDEKPNDDEVITTDLGVLTRQINHLAKLWESEVMDYAVSRAQTKLREDQHAAYVYGRAATALAEFAAELEVENGNSAQFRPRHAVVRAKGRPGCGFGFGP